MTTNSYLEYYLTLLGWIINNGIWDVLVHSGVFAIPLLAIILDEWMTARREGADEGNKGILSIFRVENRIYVGIGVIVFACMPMPFFPVDLSQISLHTNDTRK